jgi:hypothetical protein
VLPLYVSFGRPKQMCPCVRQDAAWQESYRGTGDENLHQILPTPWRQADPIPVGQTVDRGRDTSCLVPPGARTGCQLPRLPQNVPADFPALFARISRQCHSTHSGREAPCGSFAHVLVFKNRVAIEDQDWLPSHDLELDTNLVLHLNCSSRNGHGRDSEFALPQPR